MNNLILKCFKNEGSECDLEKCDYFQLQLLGDHSKTNNEHMCTLVSKESLDQILAFKWYLGKGGYPVAYGSDNDAGVNMGRGVKMHQLLKNVEGQVIDHINRNKLDNRLDNLRICSQRENSYNTSRRDNKYKGVTKLKNTWVASITKDGHKYIIRDIASEQEAAKIYDMMAEDLFGEYAGKNYM